jgi:hypothetical protein
MPNNEYLNNFSNVFDKAKEKGFKDTYIENDLEWSFYASLLKLTLVQKWLRDKHNIYVHVELNSFTDNKFMGVVEVENKSYDIINNGISFEETLLESIKHALNFIH